MKNRELLLKAIDHYEVYISQGRAVLKALVAVADENNIATISITDLSKLSKVSRQGIYNTMLYLVKDKLIEKRPSSRLTTFVLNPEELEKIIKYHEKLMQAKSFLKKS